MLLGRLLCWSKCSPRIARSDDMDCGHVAAPCAVVRSSALSVYRAKKNEFVSAVHRLMHLCLLFKKQRPLVLRQRSASSSVKGARSEVKVKVAPKGAGVNGPPRNASCAKVFFPEAPSGCGRSSKSGLVAYKVEVVTKPKPVIRWEDPIVFSRESDDGRHAEHGCGTQCVDNVTHLQSVQREEVSGFSWAAYVTSGRGALLETNVASKPEDRRAAADNDGCIYPSHCKKHSVACQEKGVESSGGCELCIT